MVIALECKSSLWPTLSRGNYNAIEDINPVATFIAAPVAQGWAVKPNIAVVSLSELIYKIKEITRSFD